MGMSKLWLVSEELNDHQRYAARNFVGFKPDEHAGEIEHRWCGLFQTMVERTRPTPPGLLLSLGDGRAIEVTWAMLYAAIKAGVCAVNAQGEPVVFTSDIPHIVRKLIQQAQEARDV